MYKIVFVLFASVLASCGSTPGDPFEPFNRAMHGVNKALDVALVKPTATVYDELTTPEAQQLVANTSANLGEPVNAINHILQGEIEPAAINTTRFILNSTVGLLGLNDPASSLGLFPQPTNLNQTFAKWGVPEGPYIELPILGPNHLRSVAGLAGDMTMNPLNMGLNADQVRYRNYYMLLSRINDRARYGNLVDMVLYQSADSYLASRLAYLQNQRSVIERQSVETEDDEVVELENFYDFE